MATAAGNAALAIGEVTRFTEMRHRLLFLLGALVVYRIGTFVPVPGIDPAALARLFESQEGTILGLFNMFSGGALQRLSIFAMGVMPYISASIILQMMAVVVPSMAAIKKEGESGRRKITQWTRYFTVVLAAVPGLRRRGRVPEPGRRHQPGHVQLPAARGADADRRHDVPDVARRADHRARHRQRHLDDHPLRHHLGPAGRDRRHAAAGAVGRDEPGVRDHPGAHHRRGDRVLRVRRERPAPHPGELREAPGRAGACTRARPATCRSSSTCRA